MDMPASPSSQWSLARRLGFRFVFAYLALYCLPFPIDQLPGLSGLGSLVEQGWRACVPWAAKHVLQLEHEITIFPGGSGDTTFNYVQLLVQVTLALFATVVWSLLDRERKSYARLCDGLWSYVRLVLATTMLGYGMNKVIQLQFPVPSSERMLTSFGDASPMGLLWRFMGSSTAYTFFGGAGEVLGGVLLFWRRTSTLGALVLIVVMTNVVALNFCYDVPVKLYSTHLLLMAVFVMLPDATRLFSVLVTHRETAARDFGPLPSAKWSAITRRVLWFSFAGWMSFASVKGALDARHEYGDLAPVPWPTGIYDVEEFARNGVVEPPLLSNATQWRRLAFASSRSVSIRTMDDKLEQFGLQLDEKANKLTLVMRRDKVEAFDFHLSRPGEGRIVLEGKFQADDLTVHLRELPLQSFFLRERGFHWINEFPLNR
jgi:multidrug transporter EmrE-like cation transporter